MKVFIQTICLGILLYLFGIIFAVPIHAQVASCTASVSPTSVNTSSTATLTFQVQNTDEVVDAGWIQISRPSDELEIVSHQIQGWSVTYSESDVIINNNSLTPNETIEAPITVSAGSTTVDGFTWIVQMAEDSGGADPVDCTGSLAVDITNAPTSTPTQTPTGTPGPTSTPTTTNTPTATPTPTPVPDTTAPRSILTGGYSEQYAGAPVIKGEAFDAVGVTKLEYSTDGGKRWSIIPNAKNLGATTVLYSFTPILSGDGQYIVQVRATDAAGNKGVSTNQTFSLDATAPLITVSTDFSHPYPQAPDIEGTLEDPAGIGIAEYSVDGKNWIAIDTIGAFDGFRTSFRFTPPNRFDDGNYPVSIRAGDSLGNTSLSEPYVLIIDRLPPQVGPALFTRDMFTLPVSDDGNWLLLAGGTYVLSASAIGGPTTIEVSMIDHETGEDVLRFPMSKREGLGVWSTSFTPETDGLFDVVATATDGANNVTERMIGIIHVLPPGTVTSGDTALSRAQVTVYSYDSVSTRYVLWDGGTYGMANPQYTDEKGGFFLWLPPGQYYLSVRASGYQPTVTNIFTIENSVPVVSSLVLSRSRSLSFGSVVLPLPDFRTQTVSMNPQGDLATLETMHIASGLVGKPVPDFSLIDGNGTIITPASLRGKPTIFSFVSIWMPTISQQLHVLEEIAKQGVYNVVVVVPHESLSKLKIFAHRGGYGLTFLADPDGSIVSQFALLAIPTHVVIGNEGTIERISSGFFQNAF